MPDENEAPSPEEFLDFEQLKSKVKRSRMHDWDKAETPRDLAISISVEAGELLDTFRWMKGSEMKMSSSDREMVRKELEKVMDKCRKMATSLGIEIE